MSLVTPPFRASYPVLFQPRENKLNKQMEYSVVALFPKDAVLNELKVAATEAIEKKWGKDQTKWPTNLRSPFRDQGEKAKVDPATGKKVLPEGHEEGAKFLTLKSKKRPGIRDASNKIEIADETEVYAGCWVRALVNAYAYSHAGNNGVSFELIGVQKVKDGESLSGRARPEDAFAPVEGGPAPANSLFD